jgi:hypothetical protein
MMPWNLKDELNVALNNCSMNIMYNINQMLSWDEKSKTQSVQNLMKNNVKTLMILQNIQSWRDLIKIEMKMLIIVQKI